MPANTESYDPTAREDSASSSTSSRSDSRRTADAADAADASDGASDETLYRTDRRRRQQGPPQMHICPMPGCDKQFVRRFNLKVHIITHDPERAHQFECIEGCGRRYTRKNDMERHVKSVHLGERLKCQTCGFRFTRVDGLRKHNCNSPMSSPYIAEGGHTPRTLRPLVRQRRLSDTYSTAQGLWRKSAPPQQPVKVPRQHGLR
ncbi:hypothetical protein DFQ26_000018 [Actinomortierella ambigua]|nr:hypothetical protein DFQ26_000018 [Actinomortierella ambigua]